MAGVAGQPGLSLPEEVADALSGRPGGRTEPRRTGARRNSAGLIGPRWYWCWREAAQCGWGPPNLGTYESGLGGWVPGNWDVVVGLPGSVCGGERRPRGEKRGDELECGARRD
ncbi:hypothetical protein NDU88_002114 [Pleurodeles waltl]|uniref:Uncharacterized protein n=1 Tax=Pleurodeles waltl TaxID=8319 RepID=A0AAV7Q5P1_PLEWA|nr:hypothetical protein NDU88_002114 [Pleurodeles waltl]